MTKILQKFAIATAGAILSFAALEANPAQAARFSFSFDDSSGRNLGNGLVDFDEEKLGLTGVGQEQVTLSPYNFFFLAQGNLSFSYNNPFVGDLGTNRLGDVPLVSVYQTVLNFDSGNLSGINFVLPPNQSSFTHPRGLYTLFETAQLFAEGATFREELFQRNISVRYPNFPCGLVPGPPDCNEPLITERTVITSGKINFSTIVPFKTAASVPEPGTAIALSLVGLSLLVKKK